MRTRKTIARSLPLILAFGLACATFWVAVPSSAVEEGYEELSYQDLVDQLRQKKKKISVVPQAHALDQIALHASLGLATSLNTYHINNRSLTRGLNGFQISVGIDLFSPEWMAELALRNYGTRQSGTESQSQREVDLKVLHKGSLGQKMGYRAGTGLSTRYIRFSDPALDINLSQESPNLLLVGGLDSYLNDQVNLGAELSLRSALIDQALDRNSMDLMVRLETSF